MTIIERLLEELSAIEKIAVKWFKFKRARLYHKHYSFWGKDFLTVLEREQMIDKIFNILNIKEVEVDKQLKKVEKGLKKEVKEVKHIEKEDKKRDKMVQRGKTCSMKK